MMKMDSVRSGSFIEAEAGATIEEVLAKCNVKREQQKYVQVLVNGEKKSLSHALQENDELKLFLPIGGG
jgi:molybdopterin converting factor small subunit